METKICPACFQSIDGRALKCAHCSSRQPDAPLMHRDLPGRVIGGVCSALSLQLGWDPILVRVLFVASVGMSAGVALWAYSLIWFLTPYEPYGKAPATRLIDFLTGLFSRSSAPSALL